MLASELQKAEYRDYLESLSYNVGLSASIWVFPKLIEYLKLALTDEIFQIQKAQIDICFEYNALPIPFEQFSLYDNADIVDNVTCIENDSDKRQVALKSLIRHVDPNNVIELWEVRHMNVNTVSTNYSSEELFTNDEIQASFLTMNTIRNFRTDDLNNCNKIEYKISKQEVYGECAALGRKLTALASEFNLTHIAATLKGLIQQVEQANSSSSNSLDSDTIQNLFLANSHRRHAKRIKLSTEIHAAPSKTMNTKTHFSDTYTCKNCLNNDHNARSCVAP
ncbi:4333_t:CDS:2, partial [Cetraspora pellucida]